MASQPNLIVNEVLWYIQQYYDKVTKTDLSSVLINFYTFDEIAFAKLQLFGVAENVDAVSLPVHTERKEPIRCVPLWTILLDCMLCWM